MAGRHRFLSVVGGRRVIVALGVLYVLVGIGWTLATVGQRVLLSEAILFVLIAGPGLVIAAAGYRLPRFDIDTEFYPTVAAWCLGGLGIMVALLGFYSLQPDESVEGASPLILTTLASVAGLAAGIHNAQARTRALELEETIAELEASNQRLERYQRYTDDVLDARRIDVYIYAPG